jgi:hypothetical protein
LNSDWQTEYVSLGSGASNTTIMVRFWTDVSDLSQQCSGWWWHTSCYYPQSDEAAKIDNVKLKGNLIPPPPVGGEVPLPGAAWLMASVLLGAGGFAKWRKRSRKSTRRPA